MNTGHDGSMGTLHANSPREAISRLESMIMMGGFALPPKTIREMITGSIDVIIQASRLRDGSRKITHITEVVGMEGDVVTLQNLIVFEITGEDAQRQDHRPPPLDRHRPAALLGARRVLRRDRAPGGGAVGGRGARYARQPAWETRVDSDDLMLLGLLALAALSARRDRLSAGHPYLSGERRADKRMQGVTENKARAHRAASSRPRSTRTAATQVADTLKELEDRAEAAREGLAAAAPAARRPRHRAARVLDRQRRSAACVVGARHLAVGAEPADHRAAARARSSARWACRAGSWRA